MMPASSPKGGGVLFCCLLMALMFAYPSYAMQVEAVAGPAEGVKDVPHQEEVPLATPKEYIVGPDDVLDISVWGESELSKSHTVSTEGSINFPLLGVIKVEGMTPASLQEQLRDRLSQGYLKDPNVNVAIREFNSKKIMVFGLVERPGLFKVRGSITLLEMLFMVGSPKEGANKLVVMRKDQQNPRSQPLPVIELNLDDLLLKGDMSRNVTILPGDIVYITSVSSEKRRFYVMGEVRAPGPYDFTRPLTLLEAIKLAGGLTDYAAPKRVQVVRKEGNKKITLKFNLKDFSTGKKSDDFMVQAGDVVVVPESWF